MQLHHVSVMSTVFLTVGAVEIVACGYTQISVLGAAKVLLILLLHKRFLLFSA